MRYIKVLFIIPSFYGLTAFSFAMLMYYLKLFDYNETSWKTTLVFQIVILIFVISIFVNFVKYNNLILGYKTRKYKFRIIRNKLSILIFIIVGMLGNLLYLKGYANLLGGINIYFLLLFADPLYIRALANEIEPVGIQITYFAWIASAAIIADINRKVLPKYFLFFFIITF